jgi:hypothetical protein
MYALKKPSLAYAGRAVKCKTVFSEIHRESVLDFLTLLVLATPIPVLTAKPE